MVETVKTLSALLAQMADGGDNTAEEVRDGIVSSLLRGGALPVNGDFSWVNQGSATVAEAFDGSVVLTAPSGETSPNLHIRAKDVPATPYTVTVEIMFAMPNKNFHRSGLCLRQSGTSELITFGMGGGGNIVIAERMDDEIGTNATTLRSVGFAGTPRFFRIEDDNTNHIFSVSTDGDSFVEFFSQANTTFLTADQIGAFVQAQNQSTPNLANQVRLVSWVEA